MSDQVNLVGVQLCSEVFIEFYTGKNLKLSLLLSCVLPRNLLDPVCPPTNALEKKATIEVVGERENKRENRQRRREKKRKYEMNIPV